VKNAITLAAAVLSTILVLGAMLYGARMFSNTVTPITVYEVEPGVKCATMVTAGGAAISCWQVPAKAVPND